MAGRKEAASLNTTTITITITNTTGEHMQKLFYSLIALILIPSFAMSDELAAGKFIDGFATVSGGWFLDKKCNILPQDERIEFEWHVANLNFVAAKTMDNQMRLKVQQSAGAVAMNEKYGCDNPETEQLVKAGFQLSKQLYSDITQGKGSYTQGVSDKNYFAKDFLIVKTGLEVGRQCDTIDKAIASDVESTYEVVLSALKERYGQQMDALDKQEVPVDKANCNSAKYQQIKLQALAGLQNLKRLFVD